MEVFLTVVQTGDDSSEEEFSFVDRESISIGRDSSADLVLHDSEPVVSRFHARLDQKGETYTLTDLGSRNGTLLQGDLLEPDEPNELEDGDKFIVAKYEITFRRIDTVQSSGTETVLQINPFLLPAEELANAVRLIQAEFENSSDARKQAALSQAFRDVLPVLVNHDTFVQLVQTSQEYIHGVDEALVRHETHDPGTPEAKSSPQETERREPPPLQPPNIHLSDRNRPRVERVLDVLFVYLARQIKVPWQFKLEFIGHTFVPSSDTKGLYQSDAQGMGEFILSPHLDENEFEERLKRLQEGLDNVMSHQMALLDGYRDAVRTGTKAMIEELDPRRLEQDVLEENSYLRYGKFLAPYFAWPRLLAKYFDLDNEDMSVFERRIYRPAFIKSYLESMNR